MDNSSTNAAPDPDSLIELAKCKAVNEYFQEKVEGLKGELSKAKDESTSDIAQIQTQESERRVVCLIDGDEMTFSLSQIAKGTAGGRVVAATLMDALKHLADHSQITIRAWVFFNKNEILKVSGIRGNSDVSRGIEDFVVGFNRTNDRFLMADVGTGKVSPKVKACLEDEARASQTYKVVFAGGRNVHYLESIRSLVAAGHGRKLVFLRRDQEPALDSFGLPILKIPSIFEGPIPTVASGSSQSPPEVPSTPPGLSRQGWASPPAYRSSPFGEPSTPSDTKGASRSASSSNVSWRSSPQPTPKIDPKKPMSKQNPPPCNMFYLTSRCKYGDSCNFCHAYVMNSEQIETLRVSVKKTPCATVNRG
ncbi:hypothetical protein NLI96_g2613 [Meripilus lineatus]|uniref:C3H1-type domain-containing protein n=1 Tax=Meripilus lineatus TaxID=2056292 RepID=A0AAD5VCX2_9APHY|nr:hypothetical protein NLI96_g2613 [Physisporinus lineatus]